ncbi:hypothetical protein [Labilibaculum manganireducens]|uniref:Uncharacterized protein n=1 Tax=Labilibaculum manganireducens TaxID=1940525 RepID=A0A2N3HT04_9BACT|nr:hypothetical protein [Labilibaculum manganireducens]PKQ61195.1 hypothetical protein BZG01_19800 [Labilibaculum manganireducens]
MRSIFVCILSICYSYSIYGQEPPKYKLNDIMNPKLQDAIGVDLLSEEQKDYLLFFCDSMFKKGYYKGYAEAAKTSQSPDVIETRINGEFTGWEGETVVKLINGEIWLQQDYQIDYKYLFSPEILIYKSSSGVFKMKIEGVEKSVIVKRLK